MNLSDAKADSPYMIEGACLARFMRGALIAYQNANLLNSADRSSKAKQSQAQMTPATFRRIALSLPGAIEGSHFSNADFRIAGKIFATLALEHQGYGVLLLTRDQQAGMVQDAPEIFSPVPGGWGEKGATRVNLAKVPADILEAALRVAWCRKAPKRLLLK
jgi:hypothetical protein